MARKISHFCNNSLGGRVEKIILLAKTYMVEVKNIDMGCVFFKVVVKYSCKKENCNLSKILEALWIIKLQSLQKQQ